MLVHVNDNLIFYSAPLHIEGMCPFNLVAGADATGTAYAPIMIEPVSFMGQIYRGKFRTAIFEARMVYP
jgi:hypothetical protein